MFRSQIRLSLFSPVYVAGTFSCAVLLSLMSGHAPVYAQEAAPSPAPAASPIPSPASASDDDLTDADYAEMGEAGPIVRELRQQKNKLVVFIYDVSGSMNQDKMIRRARQTAANIVRRGTFPSDAVSLYTFGAGYDHQNFKITRGADRPEVVEKLPKETGEGAGTNIRKPHHDALREIDKQPERPAAIVFLTDSFNDEPKPDDPKYADYRKYYTPGGMLTKYPKTGENSDYERLLAKWVQSGKVKQYGVGINFAENGRPIERLPQAAPPPVEVAATPAPTVPTAAPEKPNNTLWIVLAGVAVAAVGGFFLAPLFKTASLRITGGPSGAKDFALKSGAAVRIGGDGANFSPDAYSLPGVAQTVAVIRVRGGRMVIAPPNVPSGKAAPVPAGTSPASPTDSTGGNQTTGPRVYHNGLLLEAETPMGFGDEVRVSVPTPGGVAKEYRLKFEDAKKAY